MDMSIAALSVDMHQAQLFQDIGIKVLEKAMDVDSEMVEETLQSLDSNLGNNIDIKI